MRLIASPLALQRIPDRTVSRDHGTTHCRHGSRDPNANVEFEALVAAYRAARPDIEVVHGYVELAHPSLLTALRDLAQRADSVVVLPLFLFAAGHVKNDIPLALSQARQDFPTVRFTMTNALGVHPNLVELAFERARTARGRRPRVREDRRRGRRPWLKRPGRER